MKTLPQFGCAALLCMGFTVPAGNAAASSENVLYSFSKNAEPFGRLLDNKSSIMYGTAYYGETGGGSVYQFQQKRGSWKLREVVQFGGGTNDGRHPYAGVVASSDGAVYYGTTAAGGTSKRGTIFSITHAGGSWTKTILHNFTGSDGARPYGMLLKDKATGVLYGTALQGGSANCGTFFGLDPKTGSFAVLYNFLGGSDGCKPQTQLRAGAKAGTLVGSTAYGGDSHSGTVFLLQQNGGVWTEHVVHALNGSDDGAYPADFAVANDGIVYGVASSGGTNGAGVVFRITNVNRRPNYSVLYNFTGGNDGSSPLGIQIDDSTGVLYGITSYGGTANFGTLFALTPVGSQYTESVVHSFTAGSDGAYPISRPIIDGTTGQLFGTTLSGGRSNHGVIYAVTP
jgi:uncharacterized repeat protein (TIGR03803 family)